MARSPTGDIQEGNASQHTFFKESKQATLNLYAPHGMVKLQALQYFPK